MFAKEGPITSKIDVVFNDDSTDTMNFPIQVGTEGYAWDIFSFEDEEKALETLLTWSPISTAWDGSVALLDIDSSTGAEGSSSSAKVTINDVSTELQLFTKKNSKNINAKMDKSKLYTYSFWAKASTTMTVTASLENRVKLADQTYASEAQDWINYLWQDIEIGTEWAEYTFDIDPSGQTYQNAENVYVLFKLVPEATGAIWFDEVSLKQK